MLKFKQLAVGSLLAVAVSLSANAGGTLDISLSNSHFRLGADATRVSSGVHLGASVLHDEDKGDLGEFGFHVVETRPRSRNVFVGIGLKAHIAHLHEVEENVGAIGVGGFFRYGLPVNPDINFAGYAYVAPSVLSFNDTKNLVNTDIRVQYNVIPSARLFVGYRYVGVKLEDYNKRYRIGDGLHLGVSLDF